jgi:hypothetical protein
LGAWVLISEGWYYVCRGAICSLPIVNPEALAAALREA